jgi:uncharacterized membrane protein YeiH
MLLGMNYLGDIVFAVSGALTAGCIKMDLIGYDMIGTITGIGGGTSRDLLLGCKVRWTSNPQELTLRVVASVIAYFYQEHDPVSSEHRFAGCRRSRGLSFCVEEEV